MRPTHDPRIARALDAMERQIGDRWHVRDLAALVDLSPSRFAHLFRRATGVSPARYLQHLRMERSGQLLARTTIPVHQVMRLVGCPDPSHFGRNFRSHFGVGPREYRRRVWTGLSGRL
jgi:AraC family transcriptional regulator, arabinose operon regulatory protein